MKQYPVRIYCPISNTDELVFFHEVQTNDGYKAAFDGCDHQFSACAECSECKRKAYEKLVSGAE